MDAHRLRSLIDVLRGDYEELEISSRFSQMIAALKAYANGPSPDTATEYSSKFDVLRRALRSSRVHEFLPLQHRMLSGIGGAQLTGEGLVAAIEEVQGQSTTPADILAAVQVIHGDFSRFHKAISQLSAQFDALGIKPHAPLEGLQEISIILPDRLTRRELSEIEALLHKWGIAVGQIQELVTGRGAPVRVASLDEGSVIFVLATAYSAAFATLKLVNACLDAYEKILRIRQTHRDLDKLNVSKETLTSLAKDELELAERGVDEIAAAIVADFGSADLGGRSSHERLALTRKTVQFVLRQIDEGVEVEILLLPPAGTEEGDDKGQKLSDDSVSQALKLSASSWHRLPRERAPILALPEPEFDDVSPGRNAEDQAADTIKSEGGDATPPAPGRQRK